MNTSVTGDSGVIASLYFNAYEEFHGWTKASVHTFNIVLALLALTSMFCGKGLIAKERKLSSKQVMEINKKRKYGHWTPDYSFKTPNPAPYEGWDIKTTKPIPYRAFRHKYTITMGIRSMEWDEWFELDNEWLYFHEEKLKRMRTRGREVYETCDVAMDAAYELLDEMWQYLPQRYPTLFKQTKKGLDNLVTGESLSFRKGYRTKEDPMAIAAMLVQDDLAVMIENEDGEYQLKAGAIMLAGFWKFRDKLHMTLNDIHTSGDVPKYKEKLQSGMEKFFIRQAVDKPVVRNNYFIQTDNELAWSSSIGDEDAETVGWYTAQEATSASQLYFRSERQSLRRLPKSGATIFTIRTYFIPMVKLCEEPYIPRRLLNAILSWDEDVEMYRGLEKFKDVIIPYLEEKTKEQEDKGIFIENENSKYPF